MNGVGGSSAAIADNFTLFAPAKEPTGRVTLKVAGLVLNEFLEVEAERNLKSIAGRFAVGLFDKARVEAANTSTTFLGSYGGAGGIGRPITEGMACQLLIDGELFLDGYIDTVRTKWSGSALQMRITGRDKTGDLVDCAAVPNGPAEFKNVDLLHIAETICKDRGISVKADVPVGDPFVLFAPGTHETALAALEKAARQRAVLLVSDGIGGLLLTQGGKTRAPAAIQIGGNVQEAEGERSWEHRFSDYFVKGQTANCDGARDGVPAYLDSSVQPVSGPPAPEPVIAPEASAIVMTGHVVDPEITRWRPTVRMSRTQSGSSSVQEQAEWALRVARGEGDNLKYTVLDWRVPAGPGGTLWRPNQVSAVFDPFALINKDMLIDGVRFTYGAAGLKTQLQVVGVTAYDRINEAAKKRGPKTAQINPIFLPVSGP